MPRKRTRINQVCQHCGRDFLADAYEVSIGKGRFCRPACHAAYVRANHEPPIIRDDGTALIPLRGRGDVLKAYAIIDGADAEWAGQWKWHLHVHGYAARGEHLADSGHNGAVQIIMLHRELLGLVPGDGLDVDHISKDRLDNRRLNLRIVPKGKNPQNQSRHTDGSSSYRGVTWFAASRKWKAQVNAGGKVHYLGLFESEAEAAEVAKAARLRLLPYAVD